MAQTENPARPSLILIASDQEWLARSLDSLLGSNGYAVLRAYTGKRALELARSTLPDAVLLDVKLPDIHGLEVCRELRADPHFGVTFPVVVTASDSNGRERRLEALSAGAWEYCSQPLDGEVLLLKLRTFIESRRACGTAREDGLLDELTGLYNLRGITRRAREIGAEAQRRHAALACVAFAPTTGLSRDADPSLDRIGSTILTHLGEVCRRSGRTSDAVGRLGLAEFAVVAPSTSPAGAVRLVQRLQAALDDMPLVLDGERRSLSLCAGYDAIEDFAHSPVDATEMLFRATAALRDVRASVVAGTEIRSFEETSSPGQ